MTSQLEQDQLNICEKKYQKFLGWNFQQKSIKNSHTLDEH